MIRGLLSSEMGHEVAGPQIKLHQPSSSKVQLRLDDKIYPLRSKLLVVYQYILHGVSIHLIRTKTTYNLDNIDQKEYYLK